MKYCSVTITLVVVYFAQILKLANGSQRICMQLENVDSDETHLETRRRSQGTQGKKGPKGDVGSQGILGPVGPPGRVDYERINATIQATCDEKIQNIRTEFQQKMNEMESRMMSFIPNCEIIYLNVCYWVEIHSSRDTNFAEAESICEQRQSIVADVIDQTQYELLAKKIRFKILNGQSYVSIWTGLKKNPSTGVVTISTGTEAPYLKWHPGHPIRSSTRTNIPLRIKTDAASSYQGMFDIHSTYKGDGVVCQFKPQ